MKGRITHLFVYGTLRAAAAHPLQRLLHQHARWLGAGQIAGRLYDLGRYPGLIPDAMAGAVHGDVYRVRHVRALLNILDRYEACAARTPQPREYRRIPVRGRWKRRWLWVWVYVYGRPTRDLQLLPDGNYLSAVRGRRLSRTQARRCVGSKAHGCQVG